MISLALPLIVQVTSFALIVQKSERLTVTRLAFVRQDGSLLTLLSRLQAALGFFIASEFGSGYSWVAQKMDITGKLSPVFFIGCGIGETKMPPLWIVIP